MKRQLKPPSRTVIVYAHNAWGYIVQVLRGAEVLHEYRAGNARHDSQVYLEPDSRGVVSRKEISRYAKQTANEIGDEYKVLDSDRAWDEDLQAEFDENFTPLEKFLKV